MKAVITAVVGGTLIGVIQHILGITVTSNVIPKVLAIVVNFTICGLVGSAIMSAIKK